MDKIALLIALGSFLASLLIYGHTLGDSALLGIFILVVYDHMDGIVLSAMIDDWVDNLKGK